jgi:hypothetical protein
MKMSEIIAKVISLATAIRDYWNVELPKRHPHYPVISLGEDSGPPPPEEQQLKELLSTLSDEEIYDLLLVMYLGRGDFGAGDLATNYRYVTERFPSRERAISQLRGKAPLADYLCDGLAELQKSGINADQLNFALSGTES